MKIKPAPLLIAILLVAVSFAPRLAAQTASASSPPAAKAGKEAACDGALEIVPRKEMTFARKRRPAAKPATSEAKPDRSSARKNR